MAVSPSCFRESNLYFSCMNGCCSSRSDKAFAYIALSRFGCFYAHFFEKCSRVSIEPWKLRATGSSSVSRPKLSPTDVRVHDNNRSINHSAQAGSCVIEIPISCYQILGVPDQAEKDEIVKAVMHLKNAEIEEGYTTDVVISRQNLLMDVRDKLLFEPEYAGNTRENVPPKSCLQIPWAWLPCALCLLQEVGEEKLVLDIGRKALQHPDAKHYIHDLLLSMALAECAIAKFGFERNNISQGFEALARAQCLLRSKISLGKMTLLSQIEESLEELAPACTLELLGMPHTPENAERRLGAIAALRELLRQGLDVETPCQVQDWPCFLIQALTRLMATEIVELLSWDNLAMTRKNKKSIESQNQRVVINFNCFYLVLIAHIALGVSSKQKDLIEKAKRICECLIASEGIDLKFEEAFCLFLLGQGDEAVAAEKLEKLELIPHTSTRSSILGKEPIDASKANQSLESWLKEAVLGLFPDTRDCSASLVNFFGGGKHSPGNRLNKRASQNMPSMSHRPLSHVPPLDRRVLEDTVTCTDTSRHLGLAVKQLTPPKFQAPVAEGQTINGNNIDKPSVQLKRSLGSYHGKVWEIWLGLNNIIGKIVFVTALGCILFTISKLMVIRQRMRTVPGWGFNKSRTERVSNTWMKDSSSEKCLGPTNKLKKLLSTLKIQRRSSTKVADMHASWSTDSPSSSMPVLSKRQMPMEEAEILVRQWQAIKADALGPNHQVHGLFEVLDESMLVQWQALADEARTRSCFWRFVLLQMSVKRAHILSDDTGNRVAEIEALLEEAAELVDKSQPKNPNYYSSYTIRVYSGIQHPTIVYVRNPELVVNDTF